MEVGGGEHDGEGDERRDELREAEDEAAGCSWHALNIFHPHWRSIVSSACRAHRNRNYRTNSRSAHVHHVKVSHFDNTHTNEELTRLSLLN